MPTAQLNITLTNTQREKLNSNARAVGKRPTDYMRDLLDKEDEYLTGAERVARAIRAAKAMRKAGLVPR